MRRAESADWQWGSAMMGLTADEMQRRLAATRPMMVDVEHEAHTLFVDGILFVEGSREGRWGAFSIAERSDPNMPVLFLPDELSLASVQENMASRDEDLMERVRHSLSAGEFIRSHCLYQCEPGLMDVRAWFAAASVSPSLQRNDCSRLHKFIDACRADNVPGCHDDPDLAEVMDQCVKHVFVVKHDWRAALGGSTAEGDEYELPYDHCAFEFRVAGRTLIYLVTELITFLLTECGECWEIQKVAVGGTPWRAGFDAICEFLQAQVRAICIALDADVATHSVIRAPHKLNEKRERVGKSKLRDFHVVDLARRHRVANPSTSTSSGVKKRLHFRRGHWRHYESSKTWVKWCLVGNPDLGFITKEYSL